MMVNAENLVRITCGNGHDVHIMTSLGSGQDTSKEMGLSVRKECVWKKGN